jgi:hypothetical protein
MQSSRRLTRMVIGVTSVAALTLGTPALADAATPAPLCQIAAISALQPFLAFSDPNGYVLAPGGSFEGGLAPWATTGAASIVEDNEPWRVGGPDHHRALSLAPGATAQTAPMCVDSSFPAFRLFARGTANRKTPLNVQVILLDARGATLSKQTVQTDTQLAGGWRVIEPLALYPTITSSSGAPINVATRMALRFSTPADGGSWRIDDVYVDPWRRS